MLEFQPQTGWNASIMSAARRGQKHFGRDERRQPAQASRRPVAAFRPGDVSRFLSADMSADATWHFRRSAGLQPAWDAIETRKLCMNKEHRKPATSRRS